MPASAWFPRTAAARRWSSLLGAHQHRRSALLDRRYPLGLPLRSQEEEIAAREIKSAGGEGGRHRRCASRRFPAATSRRWCWRAGWRASPKVLILDEPTKGIDVGAKSEISELIAAACARRHGRSC